MTAPAGDDSVEVLLHGDLDLSTYEHAARRVEDAERQEPALLVIDLSHLTFVDSSGVRLVLLAHDRARAAERRLAVRLGTGQAQRVFEALGLTDKLEVLPPQPAEDVTPGSPSEAIPGPRPGAQP